MRKIVFSLVVAAGSLVSAFVQANTIACPQKDPLFSVTIPNSWTATWDKDGSLTCMPPNHSKYVTVVPSENVNTKAQLRAQLSQTAREAARNAKMSGVKLGPMNESIRKGMDLMSITAHGTVGGKPTVFTFVAFAPRKDNYFTVIAVEPAGAGDRQIGAIIDSISSAR